MHKSVLRPVMVVFGFWWVILWFWAGMPLALPDVRQVMDVAAVAGATALLVFGLAYGLRRANASVLKGGAAKMARSTIGPVPGYQPPKRCKVDSFSKERWPLTHAWLHNGAEGFEAHRRLFRAILETMAARPELPAAPEPGGHGGCTLIEHCLNVVETGFREAEHWRLSRKNHPNDGWRLGEDAYPLMPLVLLAHDLGKIVAFRTEKGDDTKVIGRKPYHDRESARLVALMEESWELSEDEHNDLIMALSFEHHPQDLPLHAPDRARLLMEFLIHSDRVASENEGRRVKGLPERFPSAEAPPPTPGEAPEQARDSARDPAEAASRQKAGSDSSLYESGQEAEVHPTHAPAHTDDSSRRVESSSGREADDEAQAQAAREQAAEVEQMWDWLREIIARPGTINGRQKQYRIGFWDGKRLYLNEADTRKLLASEYHGDTQRAFEQAGDGRFPITTPLLEALDAKGVLVRRHDGREWNAKNALFKVKSTDPDTGKVLNQGWNSAIVLEFTPDTLPVVLGTMSPAPKPPRITGAVFPQHALRKRSSVPEEAEEPAPDAPEKASERLVENEEPTCTDAPSSPAEEAPEAAAAPEGAASEDPFAAYMSQALPPRKKKRKPQPKGGEACQVPTQTPAEPDAESEKGLNAMDEEPVSKLEQFSEDDLYAQYEEDSR